METTFEWTPVDHGIIATLMKDNTFYSYIFKDQNANEKQGIFLTSSEEQENSVYMVTSAMTLIHAGVTIMGSLDMSDINVRKLINVIISKAELRSDLEEIDININQ